MAIAAAWGLVLALIAAGEEPDRPYVEILQSSGAIDGPAEGGLAIPRWERVRVELRVKNRLELPVGDLELEIALVSAGGSDAIPGWTFRETVSDTTLEAEGETFIKLQRELPARRTSPPADEIAYRVRIQSFRVTHPDLDVAITLLGSSAESDQRAALRSFEPLEGMEPGERDRIADEIAGRLLALQKAPSPSDALKLLLAVRALGGLGSTRHAIALLSLPDRLDRDAWGRAVLELASRMIAASAPEQPRLRLLPSWAREQSALLTVRAPDALEDAVRDAILRMGDQAVPALLLESHGRVSDSERARALRLLHSLGRTTVRSQLSLRDTGARLGVIEVLGHVGSIEAVPVLAELLRSRDKALKEAAGQALGHIGAGAIDPLVDTLGGNDDRPVLDTIEKIGARAPAAVRHTAERYGLTPEPKESVPALLARLGHHLEGARRGRLVAEVDRALELGREGSYTEAFNMLDRVFSQDQALYMSYAVPIADLYLGRAKRLFARGDFDATITTVRTGLGIHRSPAAEALLLEAELALVRGFIELGDLNRATEALADIDPETLGSDGRALQSRLLARRASEAIDQGDDGRARTLLDRARSISPADPELILLDRKLVIRENVAILIVLGFMVPGLGLSLVVSVRRRIERAKMQRLATAIDEGR